MEYHVLKKLLPHIDLSGIKHNKTVFRQTRYHVMYGGRGGGKSVFVAKTLALEGFLSRKRILCAREIQRSISESVMAGLWDAIVELGLDSFYTKTKTEITGENGTVFLFMGLRTNITNVKSIANIDFVWCEEAEAISADSWTVLIPSIRSEGSRIIITFNPKNPQDETYQRFVINHPEDAIVTKINWSDNKFFPDVLNAERVEMLENDPDLYRHVWEGEPVADSDLAIIPPKWIAAAVDIHKYLGIEPSGSRRVGFDVADEGPDANAITKAHGFVIQELHEWRDNDPNSAANEAWNQALEYRADEIIFDNIGVGAGAKGELRNRVDEYVAGARVPPTITGFNAADGVVDPDMEYSEGKSNRDMFYNQKAQAWWCFRDRCYNAWKARNGKEFDADKLVSFDSESIDPALLDKLRAELAQPRREYLNGKVRVEPKDKMKKRGVKSPNLADSAIMAFAPKEADILSIFY